MSTNNLDFEERLAIGKQNEKKVLKLLNKHRPVVCHTVWDKWVEATTYEDKSLKIDAWTTSGLAPAKKSVQIKYRESGGDLGIALIRPFGDFNAFKRGYENGQVDYDRDFTNHPDFYACLAGNILSVVEGEKVTKGCNIMLEQFIGYGGFNSGRSFSAPGYHGAELRLVRDQGGGYSAGQNKIICYLGPAFIRMAGGYIKELN